jgi:hypothetical protein
MEGQGRLSTAQSPLGPPPSQAPRGRPTVLTDLPGDVLAHILSFIPFEEWHDDDQLVASRFVAAAACTALAAAARPPSAAWTDVDLPKRFFETRPAPVAAQHALRDAMARAAPSVRRLSIDKPKHEDFVQHKAVDVIAPVAPFLEEFTVLAPVLDLDELPDLDELYDSDDSDSVG